MGDHFRLVGLPPDLTDYTQDFTGRAWVMERIDQWLASETHRSFFLVGGPGTGKTAIAARLVELSQGQETLDGCPHLRAGFLSLAYFCRVLDPVLDPLRFVEHLSGLLAARYPAFRSELLETDQRQVHIEGKVEAGSVEAGANVAGVQVIVKVGNLSPQVAFDRLVRRPLEALYADGCRDAIVVLVDGLDEALTYSADENVVSLLGSVVDRGAFPDNVRFLFTSRPDERVITRLGKPDLDLLADAPLNLDDVRTYVGRRLHRIPHAELDKLADRVARAGAGNFLYARYVVDEILAAVEPSAVVLPGGLHGLYREFLKRELARKEERWTDRYRVVLGILAVARNAGLTVIQVAGASGLEEDLVDDTLATCSQYLTGPDAEGRYRIYHNSFREFLVTDQSFKVYPALANRRISDYFLQLYAGDWANCDDRYALAHTPTHLIEAIRGVREPKQKRGLAEALTALLMDLEFLEVKTALIGIHGVLSDFRVAEDLNPPVDQSVQQIVRVLEREAHNLGRLDKGQLPGYFCQQVCITAMAIGATPLVEAARRRLQTRGTAYVDIQWCSGRESSALEFTLSGHQGSIVAVAFASDGHQAVSRSNDRTIKVWDLDTRAEVRTLAVSGLGLAMVVTSDDRQVVSGSRDGLVEAWDLESGIRVREVNTEGGAVRALTVGADPRYVVSGSTDGVVRVWDLEAGVEIRATPSHGCQINSLAVTRDGRWALSGGIDGALKVWDLSTTGAEVRSLTGHGGWVEAVAVTTDGRRAVSGSLDNTLRVWDLELGVEVLTLSGHGPTLIPGGGDGVYALAITQDGRRAVSGANDGVLKVWDLDSGDELETLWGHGSPVFGVAVTPDGRRAISGSRDGTLKVWSLAPSAERAPQAGHAGPIGAVAITPDGRRALSASYDRTIKVWSLVTGSELRTLPGHIGSRIGGVAVTPDGLQALSGALDGTLKRWDVETGAEIGELPRHRAWVHTSVAVTPDGRRAVSCAMELKVSDMATATEVWTSWIPREGGLTLAITTDGLRAVVGGLDGSLQVWDLASGDSRVFSIGKRALWAVAVTPDNRLAVCGFTDGGLQVHDLETGAEAGIFAGHTSRVIAVAVTPDGRLVVSGSDDRTLKIWDLNSRELLATATMERAPAAIAIGPDCRSFVAGDVGGNLYSLRYLAPTT